MPLKHVSDKYKSVALDTINNKPLYYRRLGNEENIQNPVVFVHGLGGSNDYFMPLISTLGLVHTHVSHLYDFEGHGLSPTSLLSKISIESLAEDLNGVFEHASIAPGATLVAHSIGCLIAVQFILANPGKVSKLILLGPPKSPIPDIEKLNLRGKVHSVRANGMSAAAKSEVDWNTSKKTLTSNPVAATAVKLSVLGQDPEGYAKACQALVDAQELDFGGVQAKTLIITGSEDEVSPPELCEKYKIAMQGRASVEILAGVRHWHVFEDCAGVAKAVKEFIE
jgi:pimeloyl-ACP methyl ester carboxylesterase